MVTNFGKRLQLAIACLFISLAVPLTAPAQLPTTRGRIPLEDNQPQTAPTYAMPLGSAMEEYAYPFPVSYLSFEIEREPVRMAYMDVRPTANANGRTVRFTSTRVETSAGARRDRRSTPVHLHARGDVYSGSF